MKTYRHVVASALAVLVLLGCENESAETLIASAKTFMSKADDKSAIIQLKNALQKKPDSAEARFLLGKALLDTGDAKSAEVELAKALELKYSKDLVLPPLAAAMNAQARFKELTDQYGNVELGEPYANANLKTSVADAYSQQGNRAMLSANLAQALNSAPKYSPARVMQARVMASERDFDGALKLIDDVLASDPAQADALKFKGDIMYLGKADAAKAMEAYRAALKLKADLVPAHAAILAMLVAQKDYAAAATQLADFKKAAPANPEAQYYEAILALHNKDYKAAKQLSQQLLNVAPNNSKVLYLAGAVELQSQSFLQAEKYASQALQSAPGNLAALKLLARTYLRSGQPSKALSTLLPFVENKGVDGEMFGLVGRAYLASGDVKLAEPFFVRATKLDPGDVGSRTVLALTLLNKGKPDAAFDELESISAGDSGTIADLALINALFQRKAYEPALKAIATLERKEPRNPLAAELSGRVELARSNVPAARAHFERALAISPLYFPASSALAALDLRDKKPDDAQRRFDKLLASDPKNLPALLAVAKVRLASGAGKDEINGLLTKAIQLNPAEPLPRLMLIDRYLLDKDNKPALSAAQDAVAALPQSGPLLEVLGRVQMLTGDLNQAVSTFNRLAELEPQSQRPHLRLAEAYVALKQNDAAIQSLKRALVLVPDSVSAQRGLIMLQMASGRPKESLSIARTLQEQHGNDALGYAFEGAIDASLKNWDSAAVAYRSGLQKEKSTSLAVNLHTVLMEGGKRADADRFATGWIKENPKDFVFLYYMADSALKQKEYAQAEAYYQAFIRLRPNSPIALNNLAWLTAQLKKPGAIAYAEQANKAMPNQPVLMDTLAMLLADDNQGAKALALQRKAVELAPKLPSLRLNLAKMLLKSGDKAKARAELDTLSRLADEYPERAEVNQLLKTL